MPVSVAPMTYKDFEGYDEVIAPVSRDPYWRELSPFFLGPVSVPPPFPGAETQFHNLENAWQYSKVYPELNHITSKGRLSEEFKAWWHRGIQSKQAHRYPAGRGAAPLFAVFGRHRVCYTVARKLLYAPAYAKLVTKTSRYAELERMIAAGKNILLLDFDGRVDLNSTPVVNIMNNPVYRLAHSYVLRECLINPDPLWYKRIVL